MKTKFLTTLGLFALIALMGLGTATTLSVTTAKDAMAAQKCPKDQHWDASLRKCVCDDSTKEVYQGKCLKPCIINCKYDDAQGTKASCCGSNGAGAGDSCTTITIPWTDGQVAKDICDTFKGPNWPKDRCKVNPLPGKPGAGGAPPAQHPITKYCGA